MTTDTSESFEERPGSTPSFSERTLVHSNQERKKKRPGESRIIYVDGDRERYLWGIIIEENDRGIIISRNDGNHEIKWDNIQRVDPPQNSHDLSLVVFTDGNRNRGLWGTIISRNDWGIVLKHKNGTYRFAWSKIKRIDEPSTPTVQS